MYASLFYVWYDIKILTIHDNIPLYILHSGRGKWKEIATLIPTRSTIQVKTHAQMVMKRQEMGEDIFSEFDHELESSKIIYDTDTLSQQDERAAHILYQLRAVGVF